MRWVTFRPQDQEADRVGVIDGDHVRALEVGTTLLGLLGDSGERLAAAGDRALRHPAAVVHVDDVRLRAPDPSAPALRDFYAFEQHVRTARQRRGLEMDPDWYELPVFYFSSPYAIGGPGDVAVPPGCQEFDFELEVAAIIGKPGSDLDPAEAEGHIAGFCVMNDWSARDIQRREMELSMGPVKGKDSATSIGPWLVTVDELHPFRKDRAFDLTMTASVNGREYSRTSHVTTRTYDAARNVASLKDANGHSTSTAHDLDNEATKVTRADGTTSQTVFNADGMVKQQIDGNGHVCVRLHLRRPRTPRDPCNGPVAGE